MGIDLELEKYHVFLMIIIYFIHLVVSIQTSCKFSLRGKIHKENFIAVFIWLDNTSRHPDIKTILQPL